MPITILSLDKALHTEKYMVLLSMKSLIFLESIWLTKQVNIYRNLSVLIVRSDPYPHPTVLTKLNLSINLINI